MNTPIGYFRAAKYHGSPTPEAGKLTRPSRYFLWSGFCLAAGFVFWWGWALIVQSMQREWSVGSWEEILKGLGGAGLIGVVTLAGMTWLFMTGYVTRGAKLYERDCRIAELERQLAERARPV